MSLLDDIRVLDLSRVLAGPWASQLLADLGANVLKVERPGQGDDTRHWGPPFVGEAAAYFLSANRGKQSVTIDFTKEAGQQLIRELACQADVLVENYKVGGLAKYGLDYASLAKLNPRLIYCSITGFGQTGPYKERAGYDYLIQAMSGLMSVTGASDGEPMKVGIAVSDLFAGMYATTGILAALHKRHSSDRGEHIDIALLDVQVATLANQALNYLASGESPQRLGNAHPNIVPYQVFAAADQHFVLAVGNDTQFARVGEVIGDKTLATDPRYATNAQRVANREALVATLADAFGERNANDWLAALEAAKVPAGPINNIAQMFADPQVQARGLQCSTESDDGQQVPGVACPIKLTENPLTLNTPPPALGEHTHSALNEWLGMSDAQIAALEKAGVV